MLKPTDVYDLKSDGKSRYEVVVGVAKRARAIADEAAENSTILIEKPVSMAIRDIKSGEYKILKAEPAETVPEE